MIADINLADIYSVFVDYCINTSSFSETKVGCLTVMMDSDYGVKVLEYGIVQNSDLSHITFDAQGSSGNIKLKISHANGWNYKLTVRAM